jgi:hypothetical protein
MQGQCGLEIDPAFPAIPASMQVYRLPTLKADLASSVPSKQP